MYVYEKKNNYVDFTLKKWILYTNSQWLIINFEIQVKARTILRNYFRHECLTVWDERTMQILI